MTVTVTGDRPWFDAKLKNALSGISDYTAPNISATYVEAEVQAIADALATLIAELQAIA